MHGPKRKRTTEHSLKIINKRSRARRKVQAYVQNLHKLLNQYEDAADAADQTSQQSSTSSETSKASYCCVVCAAPARYGRVNSETGHFVKLRCKDCKINGDIGRPPPWGSRRKDFIKILNAMDAELMESEEAFVEGCKAERVYYKPKMRCTRPDCPAPDVDSTSIHSAVNGTLGCGCRINIPWSERPEEFKAKLADNDAELVESEEAFVEGCKAEGKNYKPKMRCTRPDCPAPDVDSTCINNAVNYGHFGCGCRVGGITEKLTQAWLHEMLAESYPNLYTTGNVWMWIDNYDTAKLEMDIVVYAKSTNKEVAIIEMDGHHHFGPRRFGNCAQDTPCELYAKFLHQVRKDLKKNLHWKAQGVSMLRIAYTDYDRAQEIISEFIENMVNLDPIYRVSNPSIYNNIQSI